MRVVVTHDVDHLSVWEHWRDLVLPKFLGLSIYELLTKRSPVKEFKYRLAEILKNEWNNIELLAKYDKRHGVSSAFYFAVNNGLGISYSLKQVRKEVRWLIKAGFEVGVHGICFEDFECMRKERETFESLTGLKEFGVRMHYLRSSEKTLPYLEHLGYLYDSTEYSETLKQPYVVGRIVEIPLHIMDTYLFSPFFRGFDLDVAIEYTENVIKHLGSNDVLVVLFHQRYFSRSFLKWREWYRWLVETLEDKKAEFTSPKEVVKWKLKRKLTALSQE